jgi:hypothetical protein
LLAEIYLSQHYLIEALLGISPSILHDFFRPTLQFWAREPHAYRGYLDRHLLPLFDPRLIEAEANSPPAALLNQITRLTAATTHGLSSFPPSLRLRANENATFSVCLQRFGKDGTLGATCPVLG